MRRRSTITGISKSMSRPKTTSPGVLFDKDLDTEHLMAWQHAARALSTTWAAVVNVGGICVLNLVRRMLATTRCILSQIAFAVAFLLVVGEAWIPCLSRRERKCTPMNSPPWSKIHLLGMGYLESQRVSNCWAIWLEVLFWIRTSYAMLVTGSIHVKAMNSTSRPSVLIFQGPIKSTATESQGATSACFGSKSEYCWLEGLLRWQTSHRSSCTFLCNPGWWNLLEIVS